MAPDHDESHTLSPQLQDLERVDGINNLTEAISRFVKPSRPQNSPMNVAYVYLAFCQSLQLEGIASFETMPSFQISYRSQTHTVSSILDVAESLLVAD